MAYLSTLDVLLVQTGLAGVLLALTSSLIGRFIASRNQEPPAFPLLTSSKNTASKSLIPTRSIKKRLDQTQKQCVIFYGSQTGTAEKYALRLAKEASTRYNLQSLVADLDDFEYEDLASLRSDQIAIFVLATYGEGEPTDNAIAFKQFLKTTESQAKSLSHLRYAAFGLGSSSYQQYNAMIRQTDVILRDCGAQRTGEVGLGDDGKGTLEDDYSEWKERTLAQLAEQLNLPEVEYNFKPDFAVTESKNSPMTDVFLGESNRAHLRNRIRGPFSAVNPFPARVVEARELFNSRERNCLHLEFDVSNTTLRYETGDHLAVWPVNSTQEVDRFLHVFNLYDRKDVSIDIRSYDLSVKVPIPSRTTYKAAARYYLDIGAPVSRLMLATIATFGKNGPAKSELLRLSSDREAFYREITCNRFNLAQTLLLFGSQKDFSSVPFSFLLESVAKLQPRHYSISSSSLVQKDKISITAVVDRFTPPACQFEFKGVNTSYLLALKSETEEQARLHVPQTHKIDGPRGQYLHPTALIHVRRSKFRLPKNPSTPLIMIGPGTGVAPFRAFIQERALQSSTGRQVGRTMLFHGCRKSDEDFLYKDEWQQHRQVFPDGIFSIHTAFSREKENKKVYVQDLLHEHVAELTKLVLREDAHVYVCGDASRMAKDVFSAFAQIVGHETQRKFHETGDVYLRRMKAERRWCEDVW
jgi:NADPH-ferrihemoprotein reductase